MRRRKLYLERTTCETAEVVVEHEDTADEDKVETLVMQKLDLGGLPWTKHPATPVEIYDQHPTDASPDVAVTGVRALDLKLTELP